LNSDILLKSGMGAKGDQAVEGERLEAENAGLRRQVEDLSRRNEGVQWARLHRLAVHE